MTPYPIPYAEDSACEYWDLPAIKDEDKPINLRYDELSLKIYELSKANENDPQIQVLAEEALGLLKGVRITKRYGYSFVSTNDLLLLDKTKEVRKEWQELRSKLGGKGVCVFQGYQSEKALISKIADILILMPGDDPFDFVRLNQTYGSNFAIETGRIIQAMKKLDEEYGIIITFAAFDFLEFIFKTPVDAESTARIRRRLQRLCPSAEDLTASIKSGRVALWWD